MGVFTFIAKQDGGSWSARAYSKDNGYDDSLTAEGASQFELERALVKLAHSKSSGGGVQMSFNQITPSSAVVVVSVGVAAAAGVAAAPAAGGATAPAGGASKKEEKKEEPSEEDEDMGFSLFD
eukprot:GHRR01000268.1.p1 GENE.GHRR01000268.1~~GHRR01000268.1.p1  ORF type:complete len:123 (+),score=67.26 GHRR01000268.1:154-522(+)